mgnify:CR=1 FL=1
MYRLFYVSSARPGLDQSDFSELVGAASLKNLILNITGAIGFDGNRFAQVLEGEKETVLSLMETIKADSRHTGVVVMAETQTDDRLYNGWGMKHIDSLIFDDFESAMADA